MKRFFQLVLIALLLVIPAAEASPKKISVKAMQLVTTINHRDDIAGILTTGKTIILIGTSADIAFARAIDVSGKEIWNIALNPNSPSIATAGAIDSDGNIWIAGTISMPRPTPLLSPTPTPINPDNIIQSPEIVNSELNTVALWKIPAGTLTPILYTSQQTMSVLITALAVDRNGISMVGHIGSFKGSSGFVIHANVLGEFGKVFLVGTTATTLDGVVRHGDGSLTIVGTSSETLAGKKLVGVIDGVIIKLSNTNAILSLVRSSAPKAQRNWSGVTQKLLLSGSVITGTKTESAVTKFSSKHVPIWNYRFLSTGPTFTLDSTYALFSSTGPISQVDNWLPKKPQPILLSFDVKGTITGAFTVPSDRGEVIGLLSSKELGILSLTATPEKLSIFKLG